MALPKHDQIHLLAQIRRATINDQEAVLKWLLQKFNLEAKKRSKHPYQYQTYRTRKF